MTTLAHVADWTSPVHAFRKVERLPLYVSVAVPNEHITRAWILKSGFTGWSPGRRHGALAALHHGDPAGQCRPPDEADAGTAGGGTHETATAANAQLETLFQEVHHRVKNNLQVITSLLRLQAAPLVGRGNQGVASEERGPVHAMSLVHHLLYSSKELTDVDFAISRPTLR